MTTPGYSGTPLAKKLGIKEGMRVRTYRQPDELETWLQPLPDGATLSGRYRTADVGLVFATTVAELDIGVDKVLPTLPSNGVLWVCWPKKSSGIVSELQSRDTMMPGLFSRGLVDIKVAAISDVWSGLKFMIRKELR